MGQLNVTLVTPIHQDGVLTQALLQDAGMQVEVRAGLAELPPWETLGCLIIVHEALVESDFFPVQEAIHRQPPWSDLPIVFIAGEQIVLTGLSENLFPEAGNITLLQRPLHPEALISAIRVAQRARLRQFEVRDLLEERAAALRHRDEYLAMLAHELRNPLAPIRNAIELVRRTTQGEAVFGKAVDMLDRQTIHLTRLVNDLLDVSRLERGKVDLQLETVDLGPLVVSAAEACSGMAREKDQSLKVEASSAQLMACVDPVRMEQVIGNLIINAVKFTHRGGAIRVSAGRQGRQAKILVEDDGVGIRRESLHGIFDLFRQDNHTIDRAQGGLGIGLTVVRRLIELHQGTVSAWSAGEGKGSRFEILLPLLDHASAAH